MFKVTAVTDRLTSELILDNEQEVDALWVKARSQMNNGHTVTFGRMLINPKHLHAIEFRHIKGKEVADDSEV